MKTVTAALQIEILKIFWRAKYWIILVIYAAIGFGAGMLGASGYSLRAITELTFSVTGPNVVFGVLSVYRSFLLPLAIFMLCADVFTSEIESKSIKCVIARPVSRFDAYLAKCLAILCYNAIALGVGFIVAEAWQIITVVAAGSAGSAGAISAQAATALEALAAYALTLAPMAAFIAFAAFVSVLIHSPALVMFLCIVSYIALSFLGTLYNGFGAALFITYTGWYRMWLGKRLPLRNLAAAAGLLFSTSVAFFGFGFFIFEKRDI